jgi:ADP-heptose:LPS heptosyltransferase
MILNKNKIGMIRICFPPVFKKILFYLLFIIPSVVIAFMRRFSRFNRKNSFLKHQIRNIAVFQLGHIGDLIHTIPLLRNLKANFQSASITLVGGEWNKELVKSISYIDNYIVLNNWLWDRRKNRSFFHFLIDFFSMVHLINKSAFDLGIELKGHINSIFLLYISNIKLTVGFNYKNHGALLDYSIPMKGHVYEKDRLLSILPAFGAKICDDHFEFIIAEEKRKKAIAFIESNVSSFEKPLLSIFPGAPYAPRRWPAEKYAALLEKILNNEIGIPFIIGGDADRQTVERINGFFQRPLLHWIGNDIQLLAAFIAMSKVFIGNDTGPMHIAVALDVPTIAFFSSGNPGRWAPKPPHVVLRPDVPCSPCNLMSDLCNYPKRYCIDLISVEEAFSAVKSKFNKR